jgi:hypothetical protein
MNFARRRFLRSLFCCVTAMAVFGCSARDSWETPIPADIDSPQQMPGDQIFPVARLGRAGAIDKLTDKPFVKVEPDQLRNLIGVAPCKRGGLEFYLVRGVYVRGSSNPEENVGYMVWPVRDGILVNYYGPDSWQPNIKWPLVVMLPTAPKRVLVQVIRGNIMPAMLDRVLVNE